MSSLIRPMISQKAGRSQRARHYELWCSFKLCRTQHTLASFAILSHLCVHERTEDEVRLRRCDYWRRQWRLRGGANGTPRAAGLGETVLIRTRRRKGKWAWPVHPRAGACLSNRRWRLRVRGAASPRVHRQNGLGICCVPKAGFDFAKSAGPGRTGGCT